MKQKIQFDQVDIIDFLTGNDNMSAKVQGLFRSFIFGADTKELKTLINSFNGVNNLIRKYLIKKIDDNSLYYHYYTKEKGPALERDTLFVNVEILSTKELGKFLAMLLLLPTKK